jgi:hypothetical protein
LMPGSTELGIQVSIEYFLNIKDFLHSCTNIFQFVVYGSNSIKFVYITGVACTRYL